MIQTTTGHGTATMSKVARDILSSDAYKSAPYRTTFNPTANAYTNGNITIPAARFYGFVSATASANGETEREMMDAWLRVDPETFAEIYKEEYLPWEEVAAANGETTVRYDATTDTVTYGSHTYGTERFNAHVAWLVETYPGETAEWFIKAFEEDPDACHGDYEEWEAEHPDDDDDDIDGRTPVEKAADGATGLAKPTKLDQKMGSVVKWGRNAFLSGTKTRANLKFASVCEDYLKTYVGLGLKRANGVLKISERLAFEGIVKSDFVVNDGIAAYNLFLMAAGIKSLKDDAPEWTDRVAWRTLLILKSCIGRGDKESTDYKWVDGWREKALEWLREGVVGERLIAEMKARKKELEQLDAQTTRSKMSPEQISKAEQRALDDLREKKRANVRKVADQIVKDTKESNLSPEDLMEILVARGAVQPPPGIDKLAFKMTADDATSFAQALIERGEVGIINVIVGVLKGHLLKLAEVTTVAA